MGRTNNTVTILVLIISVSTYFLVVLPPVPKLENIRWSPSDPATEDTDIKPFKINVSDEILEDLQERLENALPFQEPLEGANQHYGMNTKLLKNVVDFWRTQYNWREREKFLNQYPQFTMHLKGLKIHFLHIKPRHCDWVDVIPIMLVHGWPGSVREFYEMIPFLTTIYKDSEYVFEVIIPSLPGYGFSEAPRIPGLTSTHIAELFKNLMLSLGHGRFYVQGGNWGSAVASAMATLYPQHVIGIHSNDCIVDINRAIGKLFIASFFPRLFMSKETANRVYPFWKTVQSIVLESGYFHLQASKPDTVGVALRDSPVGLAAYILEKFSTWSNPEWKDLEDGGLIRRYHLTTLLDNVMIYWITGSITTSMRLYAEHFNREHREMSLERIPIRVPSACVRLYNNTLYWPKFILKDRYERLIHLAEYDAGHFAAFEMPEVLAKDIRFFVRKTEALESH